MKRLNRGSVTDPAPNPSSTTLAPGNSALAVKLCIQKQVLLHFSFPLTRKNSLELPHG